MRVQLPDGGHVGVMAGEREVAVPPTRLAETGTAFAPALGGPVADGGPPQIPVAPSWLFDTAIPAPASLAPLAGCLAPKRWRPRKGLVELREAAGLSREQLAEAIGTDVPNLAWLEHHADRLLATLLAHQQAKGYREPFLIAQMEDGGLVVQAADNHLGS
jgi:hypothetical protein